MRQFCEDKLAPRAAEVDRRAEFPWDSYHDCVGMELPALGIPVEYGGSGADHVTQAIMVEELARVCASTCLTILISKLGMIPVMRWGSDDLKREYLPRVASGERQASYCLSEPDAGSDVAAMRTRAVRDGDTYVLSGTKYWITNAGISDTYTVFAKTDPGAGHRGISCFLVEKDWGVRVGKLEEKLGVRGSPTGEILLDEVRVPATHRIGEEGHGQVAGLGRGHARHRRRRAAPGRLRVHQGLPGGAVPARRQDHPDLRGHQPDPADRDRKTAAGLTVRVHIDPERCQGHGRCYATAPEIF